MEKSLQSISFFEVQSLTLFCQINKRIHKKNNIKTILRMWHLHSQKLWFKKGLHVIIIPKLHARIHWHCTGFDLLYFHTSSCEVWRNYCIMLEILIFFFFIALASLVSFCSPAPYEICPEDYAMSMVWRRTPSGELAFNRCPPNATGKNKNNRTVFFISYIHH